MSRYWALNSTGEVNYLRNVGSTFQFQYFAIKQAKAAETSAVIDFLAFYSQQSMYNMMERVISNDPYNT